MVKLLAHEVNENGLQITACATSSETTKLAERLGIKISKLDELGQLDLAIDGADEVAPNRELIKGGGGAHTREKIVASAAKEFICIVDDSKIVTKLGAFPLPVEVIPESRSLVARRIVSMGGIPEYRAGFTTDQGNQILDVKEIDISDPKELETLLNTIPGVVDNGIFAFNKPSVVLVSK